MKEKLRKNLVSIILLLAILLVQVLTSFPLFIENYYSTGIYPYLSRLLRLGFGWLPFSAGDLLYGAVIVFLLAKIIRFLNAWRKKLLTRKRVGLSFKKLFVWLAATYLVFNILWGLNYHRAGSAYQLGIVPDEYSQQELQRLADTLNLRLHTVIPQIRPADSAAWTDFKALKKEAINAYDSAAVVFPFLQYKTPSIKKMMVSSLGGYGGFSGYLNPFTGEAQMDGRMPPFSRAFVLCHEMAHQISYAAEEEANMVGYLTGSRSANPAVRYSVYQDMMAYAGRELFVADTNAYKRLKDSLPPLVRQHYKQNRDYYNSFRNPVQPITTWWYDQFLKANNQEKGMKSYSYVTAWLIAYAKKYGWEKI